jgi:putative transposase
VNDSGIIIVGSACLLCQGNRWAYDNKVTMDYSRPGKPTDNPFVESFNGSFRDECLNAHWFLSLKDAANKIEAWRIEYNHFRPHSSLDGMTPSAFITHCLATINGSDSLPGASASDLMFFSADENRSTASEKTSNHMQGRKRK